MNFSDLKTKLKNSLRFRLTVLITLLTAFLTITFTSYYVVHERHSYITQLKNK